MSLTFSFSDFILKSFQLIGFIVISSRRAGATAAGHPQGMRILVEPAIEYTK